MTTPTLAPHHFMFSTRFVDGRRLCGACGDDYDAGHHILITTLKPYTTYVCPNDNGAGRHRSIYTGAFAPELRRVGQERCICGARLVEQDTEHWELTFDLLREDGTWHTIRKVVSRHETHTQKHGLDALAAAAGGVRNVTLTRLVRATEEHTDADH